MATSRRSLILGAPALLAASKLPAMAECATGYAPITVPLCRPTPIFHDDFTSLDMTTSSHVGTWLPNDFWQNINQGYYDFAGNSWNLNPNDTTTGNLSPFRISGSVLTIAIIKTPSGINSAIQAEMTAQGKSGTPPAWSGGMLVLNRALHKFTYGYFETKMRLPVQGHGMHPGFWFYSADESAAPTGHAADEIDFLEVFGTPGPWYTNTHPGMQRGPQTVDTNWHIYGMDWQSSYIKFYVDGVLIYNITGSEATWFNVPMSIRFDYTVNDSWFTTMTDGTTPSPMTMDIDYISVWATKP